MSVYCDSVRCQVWSASFTSLWQVIQSSRQIVPEIHLACCWGVTPQKKKKKPPQFAWIYTPALQVKKYTTTNQATCPEGWSCSGWRQPPATAGPWGGEQTADTAGRGGSVRHFRMAQQAPTCWPPRRSVPGRQSEPHVTWSVASLAPGQTSCLPPFWNSAQRNYAVHFNASVNWIFTSHHKVTCLQEVCGKSWYYIYCTVSACLQGLW